MLLFFVGVFILIHSVAVGGADGAIFFFRMSRGGTAERVRGVFGKKFRIQPLLCAAEGIAAPQQVPQTGGGNISARGEKGEHMETGGEGGAGRSSSGFNDKSLIAGTVSGHLYVFAQHRVILKVAAHEVPVSVIVKLPSSSGVGGDTGCGYVTGGSKDGLVKVWSASPTGAPLAFSLLHVYKVGSFITRPLQLSVHSLATVPRRSAVSPSCALNHVLLIGTRSSEVYEVSLTTHSHMQLLEGHSQRQLHALTLNPSQPDEYATAGDDGVVRVWSFTR